MRPVGYQACCLRVGMQKLYRQTLVFYFSIAQRVENLLYTRHFVEDNLTWYIAWLRSSHGWNGTMDRQYLVQGDPGSGQGTCVRRAIPVTWLHYGECAVSTTLPALTAPAVSLTGTRVPVSGVDTCTMAWRWHKQWCCRWCSRSTVEGGGGMLRSNDAAQYSARGMWNHCHLEGTKATKRNFSFRYIPILSPNE